MLTTSAACALSARCRTNTQAAERLVRPTKQVPKAAPVARTDAASCRELDDAPYARSRTAHREGPMEINCVAHIILRVSRFEQCVAFYDALMPRLGLEVVYRSDQPLVHYVGGRTAVGIRRLAPESAGHAHEELAPGIDHLCFRARGRDDIDELYLSLAERGRAGASPGGRTVGTGLLLALIPGIPRGSAWRSTMFSVKACSRKANSDSPPPRIIRSERPASNWITGSLAADRAEQGALR